MKRLTHFIVPACILICGAALYFAAATMTSNFTYKESEYLRNMLLLEVSEEHRDNPVVENLLKADSTRNEGIRKFGEGLKKLISSFTLFLVVVSSVREYQIYARSAS